MSRSSNGSSVKGGSRLSRYMKAPLRMLIHARDFYVRSMTSCAAQVQHAEAMGYGPVMSSTIPRSYSGHSSGGMSASEHDIRELIRIASVSAADRASPAIQVQVVPRSQSVAVGRIDEDKPVDFNDDVKVGSDLLMPRSRSYAVGSMKRKGGWKFV